MTASVQAETKREVRLPHAVVRATCGCVATIAQGKVKRGELAFSVDYCPTHDAAEDLLKACKALVEAVVACDEFPHATFAGEIRDADDAIAKAEKRGQA